jgi:hypothetical protein
MLTGRRARSGPPAVTGPVVHRLYGIYVRTAWPVAGVPCSTGARWDVEIVEGDADTLAEAAAYVAANQAGRWAQSADLPDGSCYRRWNGLFEFLVAPDARRIQARIAGNTHEEALLAYLLVDALSFAMVRLGWEPLHATAVSTGCGAAAFLGESGDGKSTLAALFVRNGSRLITDDMLILTATRDSVLAQPGPPRIKLYRDLANRILGAGDRGVPMNAVTDKLIITLDESQMVRDALPLDVLYLIHDERHDFTDRAPAIAPLSAAEALPRVLAAAAGHCPSDPERIRRQFAFVTQLVQRVPVKTLTYRRNQDDMDLLRDAVLADLARAAD